MHFSSDSEIWMMDRWHCNVVEKHVRHDAIELEWHSNPVRHLAKLHEILFNVIINSRRSFMIFTPTSVQPLPREIKIAHTDAWLCPSWFLSHITFDSLKIQIYDMNNAICSWKGVNLANQLILWTGNVEAIVRTKKNYE